MASIAEKIIKPKLGVLELAKQLGANVVSLKDNQYEDFLLGTIIDSEKTGKDASREEVFQKLKKK